MNPNYNPGKFPNIAHKDLSEVSETERRDVKVLVHCHDAQAIDLMSKLLVYIPEDRLTGEGGEMA